MWPYDYFNQFSSLEIDIENKKMNARRPVFVAMWYGREEDSTEEKQKEIFERIKRIVGQEERSRNIVIHTKSNNEKIGRVLNYRLKAMRADYKKEGHIDINILGKIIESTLVICDITPTKPSDCYKFNPNVIFELGLASAWKMKQQVIILCEGNKKDIKNEIPSDINKLQIDFVDDKYSQLETIIERQLMSLRQEKGIIIKNIKTKLDGESLRVLSRRNGLMFVESDLDANTVRRLLDLGIIRTEIFPPSPITFGYCLTTIGKEVLKAIKDVKDQPGITLYPDILIDMYRVRFWHGHQEYFPDKKDEFNEAYGDGRKKFWETCMKIFISLIPPKCQDVLIIKYNLKLNDYKDRLTLFNKYLRDYPFDFVNKNTVKKWLKALDNIRTR